MQEHRATSKLFGRLDGDDRVSEGHKSCCVAPRPRADIESATRSRRDQLQDGRLSVCKRDALIALEQFRSLLGVVFGSTDPSRLHPNIFRLLSPYPCQITT